MKVRSTFSKARFGAFYNLAYAMTRESSHFTRVRLATSVQSICSKPTDIQKDKTHTPVNCAFFSRAHKIQLIDRFHTHTHTSTFADAPSLCRRGPLKANPRKKYFLGGRKKSPHNFTVTCFQKNKIESPSYYKPALHYMMQSLEAAIASVRVGSSKSLPGPPSLILSETPERRAFFKMGRRDRPARDAASF